MALRCVFIDDDGKCDFDFGEEGVHICNPKCMEYMPEKSCYLCEYRRNQECILTGQTEDKAEQCSSYKFSLERWHDEGRSD